MNPATNGKSNADRFPAFLPCPRVALKLARAPKAPSEFAGLSAILQLSAIVHDRDPDPALRPTPERERAAVHLRHLARHLDAAARIVGRTA